MLALIVLVVGLAYLFQRRLIYLPSGDPPPAGEVLPGASDVGFTTSDGIRLNAWLVPARAPGLGMTVLVAPGNAGNRSMRAPLAEALRERGLSVLLLDYRGYGGNPGDPTEEGLARDARAAYRYLVEDLGHSPEDLLYYGESLGAGVVTELATEHPPAGMLLRSPFVDLPSAAAEHYPFLPARLLLKDRFPVRDNVSKVDVPTTVVYGDADSVIPAQQSRTVASAAPDAVEVAVTGADHNDRVLLDGRQLIDAVLDLAERAG